MSDFRQAMESHLPVLEESRLHVTRGQFPLLSVLPDTPQVFSPGYLLLLDGLQLARAGLHREAVVYFQAASARLAGRACASVALQAATEHGMALLGAGRRRAGCAVLHSLRLACPGALVAAKMAADRTCPDTAPPKYYLTHLCSHMSQTVGTSRGHSSRLLFISPSVSISFYFYLSLSLSLSLSRC